MHTHLLCCHTLVRKRRFRLRQRLRQHLDVLPQEPPQLRGADVLRDVALPHPRGAVLLLDLLHPRVLLAQLLEALAAGLDGELRLAHLAHAPLLVHQSSPPHLAPRHDHARELHAHGLQLLLLLLRGQRDALHVPVHAVHLA